MASDLKSFIIKDTKIRYEDTIPVTLKSGDTREIDIQSLTAQETKKIYSRNMKTYPPAEGSSASATPSLDPFGYALDVIKTGIKAPDLRSSILYEAYNVSTMDDLIYAMFEINEVSRIAGIIQDLGGESSKPTTTGVEPGAIREAKNS